MKIALVFLGFRELWPPLAQGVADGNEVHVFIPRDLAEAARTTAYEGVEVHLLASPRLRSPVGQIRRALALLRALRSLEPDVIHLQQGHLWFNAFLHLLPAPLVMTVHDARLHPGDRLSKATPQRIYQHGWRRARQLIVHSRAVGRQLVEAGFTEADITVIPHPAIGPASVEEGDPDEDPTVLFFGRIWPYKGLDHLIRAEPAIAASVPGLRVIIAGTGEPLDRYRELMIDPDRYEIHDRYLTDAEREELFRRATVVAMPYIEASQSGVIPVAAAHARPVVATAVGGIPEMIDDGMTGRLVPPRDPGALADALGALLTDRHAARRMGQAARRKLESEWSPSATGRLTLDVYRRAIGARDGDQH